MPARTATKSGNWSDVTVWDGGATLPGSGDTADSNGYTVTIDQNIDLSPGGALIGTNAGAGGFSCSTARTITANITATVRTVLTCSNGAGVTITLSGTLTGGSSNGCHAVFCSGAGAINISGLAYGGSGTTSYAIYHNHASAIVTLTGTAYSTTGPSSPALFNATTGTLNCVGNCIGGSVINTFAARNYGAGTLTISGFAIGGSGESSYGAYNSSDTGNGILSVGTAQAGTHVSACGLYGAKSTATTTFKAIGSAANGNSALGGFCKILPDASNAATFKRSDTGADLTLTAAAGGGMLQANKRGNKQ